MSQSCWWSQVSSMVFVLANAFFLWGKILNTLSYTSNKFLRRPSKMYIGSGSELPLCTAIALTPMLARILNPDNAMIKDPCLLRALTALRGRSLVRNQFCYKLPCRYCISAKNLS